MRFRLGSFRLFSLQLFTLRLQVHISITQQTNRQTNVKRCIIQPLIVLTKNKCKDANGIVSSILLDFDSNICDIVLDCLRDLVFCRIIQDLRRTRATIAIECWF